MAGASEGSPAIKVLAAAVTAQAQVLAVAQDPAVAQAPAEAQDLAVAARQPAAVVLALGVAVEQHPVLTRPARRAVAAPEDPSTTSTPSSRARATALPGAPRR
jgi:hypothetical protein